MRRESSQGLREAGGRTGGEKQETKFVKTQIKLLNAGQCWAD